MIGVPIRARICDGSIDRDRIEFGEEIDRSCEERLQTDSRRDAFGLRGRERATFVRTS